MSEQTVSVPVEDVRKGDKISVGGVQMPVVNEPFDTGVGSVRIMLQMAHGIRAGFDFDPGTMIEVVREDLDAEDPDAELVEVIAKAICLDDGERWNGAIGADAIILSEYRSNAVAAIAAARAAGWRIERES